MNFKEIIQKDKEIFLNPSEFGEPHEVDGKSMNIIIDGNEMVERRKYYESHTDGLYFKKILFYVSSDEFGAHPAIGRLIKIDGKSYRVTDAINEMGIYSITMEANRS